MILSDWLYFIGFILFWVVLYKLTHRKKLRLSPRRMIQFLDSIDDLHDTAQKYRQIENMIIELNNIMMINQQTALRLHNMRVRNRQLREAEKTKITLLEEENELLRLQIVELRNKIYN